MEARATLEKLIAERPEIKTVVVQSSRAADFPELETLLDELSDAFPNIQFSASFSTSGRCSAVVDALHFRRPVMLFHVDPECMCGLGQKARLEEAGLQLFYVSLAGQLITDAEKYISNQMSQYSRDQLLSALQDGSLPLVLLPYVNSSAFRASNGLADADFLSVLART